MLRSTEPTGPEGARHRGARPEQRVETIADAGSRLWVHGYKWGTCYTLFLCFIVLVVAVGPRLSTAGHEGGSRTLGTSWGKEALRSGVLSLRHGSWPSSDQDDVRRGGDSASYTSHTHIALRPRSDNRDDLHRKLPICSDMFPGDRGSGEPFCSPGRSLCRDFLQNPRECAKKRIAWDLRLWDWLSPHDLDLLHPRKHPDQQFPHKSIHLRQGVRLQVVDGKINYVHFHEHVSGNGEVYGKLGYATGPIERDPSGQRYWERLQYMLSRLLDKFELPDNVDMFIFFADGCVVGNTGRLPSTPVFTYSSCEKTCPGQVAMPTYDWYWNNGYDNFSDDSPQRVDTIGLVPFDSRRNTIFWRGQNSSSCRARAAGTSYENSSLPIDVQTTDHGNMNVDARYYYENKYLLDLNGFGASARIRNILLSGSVPIKAEEIERKCSKCDIPRDTMGLWSSKELVPFKHYIPVRCSRIEQDLRDTAQWLSDYPWKGEQIGIQAREYALRLNDDYMLATVWETMHAMGQKLTKPVKLHPLAQPFVPLQPEKWIEPLKSARAGPFPYPKVSSGDVEVLSKHPQQSSMKKQRKRRVNSHHQDSD